MPRVDDLQFAETHIDDSDRKEQSIDKCETGAPEFPAGHAARQKGNGKDGQDRQHAVKGIQGNRGELSQNNVVTLQIGQE